MKRRRGHYDNSSFVCTFNEGNNNALMGSKLCSSFLLMCFSCGSWERSGVEEYEGSRAEGAGEEIKSRSPLQHWPQLSAPCCSGYDTSSSPLWNPQTSHAKENWLLWSSLYKQCLTRHRMLGVTSCKMLLAFYHLITSWCHCEKTFLLSPHLAELPISAFTCSYASGFLQKANFCNVEKLYFHYLRREEFSLLDFPRESRFLA